MFENILKFFKNFSKKEASSTNSKDTAKERLHLVLMQDRANVSADFLDLMRQEIIEVIKKYIDVDEASMDVKLTNQVNEDGTQGAPALYANIPILNMKEKARTIKKENEKEKEKENPIKEEKKDKAENKMGEKQAVQKIEEAKKIEEVVIQNSNEEKKEDLAKK